MSRSTRPSRRMRVLVPSMIGVLAAVLLGAAPVAAESPSNLTIAPLVGATLPVGSSQTVTATVSNPVVAGLPVRFHIAGATSLSGIIDVCTTNAAGECSISYSGGLFSPGIDHVNAILDVNNNEMGDAEPTAYFAMTWIQSRYSVRGFAAPVDASPRVNVAKAGQTIPLKFSVVDDAGLPVPGITGFTINVTDQRCALGSTLDQIEEYASGGSGLRDFGDGDYQFNWATPKSYARSCKQLTLSLPSGYDGGVLTAEFTFAR